MQPPPNPSQAALRATLVTQMSTWGPSAQFSCKSVDEPSQQAGHTCLQKSLLLWLGSQQLNLKAGGLQASQIAKRRSRHRGWDTPRRTC